VRRTGRSTPGVVAALDQDDFDAREGQFTKRGDAVDASANNDDVGVRIRVERIDQVVVAGE